MSGRRITITCSICHHLNRCARPLGEGEEERVIICESCESMLIAKVGDLSRDYRPNAKGKRSAP